MRVLRCLVIVVLVVGTLGAHIAYALYRRSPRFHEQLEARASERLGCPLTIASVEPVGLTGLRMTGLRAQHALRAEPLAVLDHAQWDVVGLGPGLRGVLSEGTVVVPLTDHPLLGRLIRQSAAAAVDHVTLNDVNVQLRAAGWDGALAGVAGVLTIDDAQQTLHAQLQFDQVNGCPCPVPGTLEGVVDGNGPVLRHGAFDLPALPVVCLPGSTAVHGTLRASGRLDPADERGWAVQAAAAHLDLGEWSPAVLGRRVEGQVDRLNIHDLQWTDGIVDLAFDGEFSDVQLTEIPDWPWPLAGGCVDGVIHHAEVSRGRLTRVRLSLNLRDLDLGALHIEGAPAGRLHLVASGVEIVESTLVAGQFDVHVQAAPDDLLWATPDWVAWLTEQLGCRPVEVPAPGIEIAELALRLELRGPRCRLHALDADGRSILSAAVFGRQQPLVALPRGGQPLGTVGAAWFSHRLADLGLAWSDIGISLSSGRLSDYAAAGATIPVE